MPTRSPRGLIFSLAGGSSEKTSEYFRTAEHISPRLAKKPVFHFLIRSKTMTVSRLVVLSLMTSLRTGSSVIRNNDDPCLGVIQLVLEFGFDQQGLQAT